MLLCQHWHGSIQGLLIYTLHMTSVADSVLHRTFVVLGLFVALSTGCSENENARLLKLDGLRELVCQERHYDAYSNTCGDRSVWREADSGFIAYVTIYGISSEQEALLLARFIEGLKVKNQQNIPVRLIVYSTPRGKGRDLSSAVVIKKWLYGSLSANCCRPASASKSRIALTTPTWHDNPQFFVQLR